MSAALAAAQTAHRDCRGARKLLRLEVRNAETPIERKPEWIKTRPRWAPSTRRCSTW